MAVAESIRETVDQAQPILPPGVFQLDESEALAEPGRGFFDRLETDLPYAGNPPFGFSKLVTHKKQIDYIRYKRHGDLAGLPDLPSQDAWQTDLHNIRLETPVDDRGLVKQDELIEMVYGLIAPDYKWPRELSVDHVYYNEEWYYSAWAPQRGGKFRELAIHKMLVRRMWENVKHHVMIPPAVPTEEVMEYRLESWRIAASLLKSIRNTERIRYLATSRFVEHGGAAEELSENFDELDPIARDWAYDQFQRYAQATEMHLEDLERVPPEFRLVRPETPRQEMAERLTKLAGAEALHMVHRPAA